MRTPFKFGWRHYVPVLKGKVGEIKALRHVREDTAMMLTPVIEPAPPDGDVSPKEQLLSTAKSLEIAWRNLDFFADLKWFGSPRSRSATWHPLPFFAAQGKERGLRMVPVTALDRSPKYQQAVKSVVDADGLGMALRLKPSDFEADDFEDAIDKLLLFLGLVPNRVNLILDLGSIHEVGSAVVAQMIRAAIETLPHANKWRTLSVASSAVPKTLQDLPRDEWTLMPRTEWASWRTVGTRGKRPERLPSYGDYATAHPDLPFGGGRGSAQLRYSVDRDFLVWKGQPLKKGTHAQIFDICADLVERTEYSGASFSHGDQEIQVRATTPDSPGGPTQWREWWTSHHIELVASQLASLPEP